MVLETFIKFIKINFLLADVQGFIKEIFIRLEWWNFYFKLAVKGVDFGLQSFHNLESFIIIAADK